ncbi:MAG: hypothetical protein O2818_02735 [Bacteroidetes bacterium]|nr:hypothetical protein [Bacteroidota bacterium]MDA1335781.1 hypothetical protein [Bacteroidota bacterium]
METLFKEFNKYVVSVLLFAAGLGFFIKYLGGDDVESQPKAMLVASLALIFVAIIALPVVLEKLSGMIYRVLTIVGSIAAIWLGYEVFYSVDEEIEFREKKARVDAQTIQALKDIRDAQDAYLEINGFFCNNFDTLQAFLYAEVIPVSFNMGSFNDTLPEDASREMGLVLTRAELPQKAAELGLTEDEFVDLISMDSTTYKVRDVIYTSFYAENFDPEVRSAKKLPRVSVDSLWFNPLSGERFMLETSTTDVGGVNMSTILVKDPTPFGREKVKKDTLRFGSLTDAHTDGNWRN